MKSKSMLETEEDAEKFVAFQLCQPDESDYKEYKTHYDRCELGRADVRQQREAKPYSVSEGGWWSGYADRERA